MNHGNSKLMDRRSIGVKRLGFYANTLYTNPSSLQVKLRFLTLRFPESTSALKTMYYTFVGLWNP
jgi:hypothetical protein